MKIRGEWRYLYRAVDRAGRTVDFRLSPRRDVAAAKAFFRKAIKSQQRCPRTITLDGYAASHRAVRELKADGFGSWRIECSALRVEPGIRGGRACHSYPVKKTRSGGVQSQSGNRRLSNVRHT